MKALIIGASGFVGPYLTEAVKRDLKCDVVATGHSSECTPFPGCETRKLDIMDNAAVLSLLQDEHPYYIFHLAAHSTLQVSLPLPDLMSISPS